MVFFVVKQTKKTEENNKKQNTTIRIRIRKQKQKKKKIRPRHKAKDKKKTQQNLWMKWLLETPMECGSGETYTVTGHIHTHI